MSESEEEEINLKLALLPAVLHSLDRQVKVALVYNDCVDLESFPTSEHGWEILRENCKFSVGKLNKLRNLLTAAIQAPQRAVVEKVDNPIILGIYERLAENTSEPSVDTLITFGSLTLLIRQEWIDLKNEILSERQDKHHKTIFLSGTAGRGKSSFVYYLMYCILMRAKESKKRKSEEELLIGFVKNASNKENILLTVNGATVCASIPHSVYYYIADIKEDEDRVDLAQCFTMVVASDDAGKKEFRKRVKEAGDSGYGYAMLSPTREQMHLIFKNILTADEIDFRLDVVGCNPRDFNMACVAQKRDLELELLVLETCEEILGITNTDARYKWVKNVIMQSIETAKVNNNQFGMSSLFLENIFDDDDLISVYTSTFMCFLAGKIRDKFRNDTIGVLTTLFGRSGVGNCHEYDAHNFFCALGSETHPCWSFKDNKWVNVQLGSGPRTKVTFRNINSISNCLQRSANIPQRYLLPTISNLALSDSIIPPRTVLQMTVTATHSGAVNKIGDIINQLGRPEPLIMIFVVPEMVLPMFRVPTELHNYCDMYVTVAKTMTITEARNLK